MNSNLQHDLETYGYDKSVDNGATFYGVYLRGPDGNKFHHGAIISRLFFADYENPTFDGPRKKSAQEELNLNTENSGE